MYRTGRLLILFIFILFWGCQSSQPMNGTGHGDFIKDKDGNWLYVFHAHFNNSSVHPRLSAIIQGSFSKNNNSAFPEIIFKKETFKYLLLNK